MLPLRPPDVSPSALVAAELTHPDDGHAGVGSVRAARCAEQVAHARRRLAQRLADARVGQVRELLGRPRQVGVTQEVARADPE
jgi:hypothetical protein